MADVEEAERAPQDQEPQTGIKRTAEDVCGDVSQSEPKRAASGAEADPPQLTEQGESIEIKVQFGKQSQVVSRLLSSTVAELKLEIEKQTGVPPANQRLLFKGQLRDEAITLQEAGLKKGSKIMVIGNKPEDIKLATEPSKRTDQGGAGWDADEATLKKEPWSQQAQHKKVLEKGKPDDAWPGIAGRQVSLREDQRYIPGMLNASGTKVRLTFRDELQQLWVGSATRTQKIMYASVHKIEAQPIEGNEEYSIMRLQLGASASSNYWLYYVPSQSVAALKIKIRGMASLLE